MYLKSALAASALALSMLATSTQTMARDIVMGLIPAENNEEMIQQFEPMRAQLEKKLGKRVKVFTATDYAGVIEAMKRKRVDIAWFGPLSYYLAEQEAGAEAFAVGVRKGSKSHTYKTVFVTQCNSGIKSIKDMKGKRVAFVDPASTSGGLMPTYMIKKATGQMPTQYFSKFTYAGSHDAAQLAVKNKIVDVAADSDITYNKMLASGMISKKTNCVIAESAPLPGSPLAYRKDLDAATKAKIRSAILNAHKEIKVAGYGDLSHYAPVAPKDYQMIRNMVKDLGLQKQQMMK